jgi:4'-phosphopantetheinyl transferase
MNPGSDDDAVCIRMANLDQLDAGPDLLSADERARFLGFRNPDAARRFAAGRIFLRRLLSEHAGLPADQLCFEYGPAGKPELMTAGGDAARLRFNLAHSGPHAVAVVARGRRVGVDIEQRRDDGGEDGVAARFMTAEEFTRWSRLEGPAQADAFYRIWVRKEAWLKARGEGLAGLASLGPADWDGNDTLQPPGPGEKTGWRIRDLDVSPACLCAVAFEAEPTGWR